MDEGAVLEHEGALLSQTAEIKNQRSRSSRSSRRVVCYKRLMRVSSLLISGVSGLRRGTLLPRTPRQSTPRSTPWCTSRRLRRTRVSTRTRARRRLRLVPRRRRSPKRSFRRGFARARTGRDALVPEASPRLHGSETTRTAPSTRSRTSSCRRHTRDPTAPLGTPRDTRRGPVRASEGRARGAAKGRRMPRRGRRPRRRRARARGCSRHGVRVGDAWFRA